MNEPWIALLAIGLHIMFGRCASPHLHCHSHHCHCLMLILVYRMRIHFLHLHLNTSIFLLIWHNSWLHSLLFLSKIEAGAGAEAEAEAEDMGCLFMAPAAPLYNHLPANVAQQLAALPPLAVPPPVPAPMPLPPLAAFQAAYPVCQVISYFLQIIDML